MKSPWRVTSQVIGGDKVYAVYRLLDVNAIDHSGNREFGSRYMEDREAVERIARELNKAEEHNERLIGKEECS